MVTDLTEKQAREKILDQVSEYYIKYHVKDEYKDGDRISYAARIYDSQELINLVDSSLEFWLTSGRYTNRFEKEFAEFIGAKYCALVNSGSSANLLAFMALTSPLLGERAIGKDDEVITVAAGFPTTIAPIIQYGAIPVFVDVTIPQYNIDITLLEKAYTKRTKAVMLAHTLGNPFNIKAVNEFCHSHNLWLIEDNCDSLGSKYYYNGEWRYTGTIGDIGTSSFYPPHHMTMGEGGAVYTNNSFLSKIIRSMRDWGRDCECPSGVDDFCGHRFDRQYGGLPLGYDHKYVYSHFGYNLKATDMQAAIGCAQLKKLPDFIQKRKENFTFLYKNLLGASNKIILPETEKASDPSWFGFLITCSDARRNQIVEHLENNRIQTRMLFAGNLLMHPCFENMKRNAKGYRVIGDLVNTDRIMRDSFWVGVYPGMTEAMLTKMVNCIKDQI